MRLTYRVEQLEGRRAARDGMSTMGGGVVFYDPARGPPALLTTRTVAGGGVVFLLPRKDAPPDPYAGMDATERTARGGRQ